jgi:hypothetical protein
MRTRLKVHCQKNHWSGIGEQEMAKHPHAELIKQMVDDDSLRVAPEVDMTYYLQLTTETASYSWKNDETDKKWLSDGICHATREAAQQWVDAMAEIRGAK